MKPGKELDALVAEKVMGFVVGVCTSSTTSKMMVAECTYGCQSHPLKLPHYSTDIAAAWEVLDTISFFRSGYPPIGDQKHPTDDGCVAFYKPVVRLEWYEHDGIARCIIGRCKDASDDRYDNLKLVVYRNQTDHKTLQTSAECLAYVICLAALKAVGVKV